MLTLPRLLSIQSDDTIPPSLSESLSVVVIASERIIIGF